MSRAYSVSAHANTALGLYSGIMSDVHDVVLPAKRIDQNSEQGKALQQVVQVKLKDFLGADYADDVLPLYIVVMLAHGNQADLVAENLEAFLGQAHADLFVKWCVVPFWPMILLFMHLVKSVRRLCIGCFSILPRLVTNMQYLTTQTAKPQRPLRVTSIPQTMRVQRTVKLVQWN